MVIVLRLHVNPLLGEIVKPSDTDPVKPLTGEIVIVEVPAEFTATVTAVGLAEMVKSGAAVTVYVTVVE